MGVEELPFSGVVCKPTNSNKSKCKVYYAGTREGEMRSFFIDIEVKKKPIEAEVYLEDLLKDSVLIEE